jgi:hypothetical protein
MMQVGPATGVLHHECSRVTERKTASKGNLCSSGQGRPAPSTGPSWEKAHVVRPRREKRCGYLFVANLDGPAHTCPGVRSESGHGGARGDAWNAGGCGTEKRSGL